MLRLHLFGRFRVEDDQGNEIPIKSRKAKALLAYLASPLGKARSREAITALLWSDRDDEQARGSLRQALSGLRQELGDDGAKALVISHDDVALDPKRVTVEGGAPDEVFLEGLSINDPAFEEWLRDERLRLETKAQKESEQDAPPNPQKTFLAVLPFANISNEPEQDYFADGITQDIITELSRFRSLFVIARNSTFQYKHQSPDVMEVGRELGVGFVVEGSVRKAGNRVRISSQLIDATTGAHIWAERYDRELEDIFDVQDEVAREIVRAVPGRVDLANRVRVARKATSDYNAYDLVLRAEAFWDRDWTTLEIRTLLERAIEMDPGYARAHVRLANCLAYWIYAYGMTDEATKTIVRQRLNQALTLDPDDPVNLAVAAESYVLIGDPEAARPIIDRAVKLNPHDFSVMVFAGLNYAYLGEHAKGLEWARLAMRHDPYGSDAIREGYFDCLYLAGEYEEAIEITRGWRNPPPHIHVELAAAYAMLDRVDEAIKEAAKFKELDPEGWENSLIRRNHAQMCADPADGERWLEGYRKAGVPV